MSLQAVPACDRLAELERVVERGLVTFVEVGQALLEIRYGRLYRDTHDTFEIYCRERWGFTRSHAYRLIDGATVAELVSPIGDISNEAQARELVPLLREDEQQLLETWGELRQEYGDGVTAVNVKRLVKNRLERIRRKAKPPLPETSAVLPATVDLRHCDLRDLDLEPASVDLVFTDPPYPEEFLPEWAALAELAARILKPGRLLVAYSGQYHLPTVMAALAEHLEYVWLGSLTLPGPMAHVHSRRIEVGSKPLLFYSAGKYQPDRWVTDTYESERPEKDGHQWQQSVGAALYFIERLTEPGDLIVDPFLGAGTTAVACRELGRRFVGCDVDPHALATAKERLAA